MTTGVETCEDRGYKCCEQLFDEEHLAKFGYTSDGRTEIDSDDEYPPATETRAEESAQYSPLPWQEMGQSDYAQPEADSICCIGDHNGYTIAVMIGDCIPDQKANADLIVHRVNSFETLVQALEEAQHIVVDRAAGGRMIWTVTEAKRILDQIDTALATAKEIRLEGRK